GERIVPKSVFKRTLILLAAYSLAIILLFPYLVMLITALKDKTVIYAIPPKLFPQNWAFENFINIWNEIPLMNYLSNSLYIAVGATAIALICALPAAYVLSRLKFAGKNLFIYL